MHLSCLKEPLTKLPLVSWRTKCFLVYSIENNSLYNGVLLKTPLKEGTRSRVIFGCVWIRAVEYTVVLFNVWNLQCKVRKSTPRYGCEPLRSGSNPTWLLTLTSPRRHQHKVPQEVC